MRIYATVFDSKRSDLAKLLCVDSIDPILIRTHNSAVNTMQVHSLFAGTGTGTKQFTQIY